MAERSHLTWPFNPHAALGRSPLGTMGLGSSPFARHYLGNASLVLAVLRCFTSGGSLLTAYGFSRGSHPLPGEGLPHSEIVGSTLGCSSPTLFAAAHVLLRHSTPRHPPHAPSFFVLLAPIVRKDAATLPIRIVQHLASPLSMSNARLPIPGCLVMVCASTHHGLVVLSLQLLRCKTRLFIAEKTDLQVLPPLGPYPTGPPSPVSWGSL